jgi:fused signal recognition particle receptor
MSPSPDSLFLTQKAVALTRRSFFGRVRQLFSRPQVDEATWEELEELLVMADVGLGTTQELLGRVRERMAEEKGDPMVALQDEMTRLLDVKVAQPDNGTPPQVVLVVGVNGSGKTTSIAKLAHRLRADGKRVVLAAADTFRAAAIDQLREWGQRAGADVISQGPGADPGAVTFDAIQAAMGRGADVVLVDTAGRLHTKHNLMEELKKVGRVASRIVPDAPHQVLLVLDATTGQNGLIQARHFTQAVGVSGVFLAKLDGTAKGGIVLAISSELGLPILYIGTGEGLDDIAPFNADAFVEALCSP